MYFPTPFQIPGKKCQQGDTERLHAMRNRLHFQHTPFEALLLTRLPVPTALYCPERFLLQIMPPSQSHQGTHGQFDSVAGLVLNAVKMLSNFLIITFNSQCQLVFLSFLLLNLHASSLYTKELKVWMAG